MPTPATLAAAPALDAVLARAANQEPGGIVLWADERTGDQDFEDEVERHLGQRLEENEDGDLVIADAP